VTGLPISLL